MAVMSLQPCPRCHQRLPVTTACKMVEGGDSRIVAAVQVGCNACRQCFTSRHVGAGGVGVPHSDGSLGTVQELFLGGVASVPVLMVVVVM